MDLEEETEEEAAVESRAEGTVGCLGGSRQTREHIFLHSVGRLHSKDMVFDPETRG